MNDILSAIPQRSPFLFVDQIVEKNDGWIHCQKKLTGDEDFFKGHFPGNPIMPGVLLLEAAFQTGAVLMSGQNQSGLGVVTRADAIKFKNFVRPGDLLDIEVTLEEQVATAFFMKGKIKVGNKTVLSLKFACSLVNGD